MSAELDPVRFAAGVAKALEEIATKGTLSTPKGDYPCSAVAQERARERAPEWWKEAERRAAEAQRNHEQDGGPRR
jgi:hypothetical protein